MVELVGVIKVALIILDQGMELRGRLAVAARQVQTCNPLRGNPGLFCSVDLDHRYLNLLYGAISSSLLGSQLKNLILWLSTSLK
jgi:hypothetical protein